MCFININTIFKVKFYIAMLSRVTKQKRKGIAVKYDKEADILTIVLKEVESLDYAEEHGDVIVHFKGGEPVEVDILNASRIIKRP